MYAIETQQLTRRFGERSAVDGLTLTVPTGTVFAFLGPNGAGKTTTVRMLTGLIAPSSGTARVAGYDVVHDPAAVRRRVGMLTETPGLYERLSALDNVRFFGRLAGLSAHEATSRAERYLRTLGLWERRNDRIGSFSKGMRQKVALVRALLHEPEVIFFDEPTSGLDPAAARLVLDFIKQLRAEGRTIFLTTHNLAEADELADLVGIFKGRLLHQDTPAALRNRLFGRGSTVRLAGPAHIWEHAVRGLTFVQHVTAEGSTLRITLDDPETHNPHLVRTLVQAGADIRAVTPVTHSLEAVYLELLGNQAFEAQERV
jgi:ABC-2 type transport system ATP-binding protein